MFPYFTAVQIQVPAWISFLVSQVFSQAKLSSSVETDWPKDLKPFFTYKKDTRRMQHS